MNPAVPLHATTPMPTTPPNTTPPGEHVHFPEVAWPESPAPLSGHSPWDGVPPMEDERFRVHLRLGPTAALASLAEAEAVAHALAATVPSRPTLLQRLTPSTAAWFWMAVSAWLAFLLARAEGWL